MHVARSELWVCSYKHYGFCAHIFCCCCLSVSLYQYSCLKSWQLSTNAEIAPSLSGSDMRDCRNSFVAAVSEIDVSCCAADTPEDG